ncbi:unnamed protein product [Closterium sp. Naga37s-1]|nr:unnamed protein product [Closterium sp. Naga37s-1]
MGFDTLLIGPVTVNSPYGYHGYWPRGFTTPRAGGAGEEGNPQAAINPHLGTPKELKALVDAAHAMGFLVMIDVVLNHVGCPQGGGPCDTWQEGIRPPPWLNDSYAPFNESVSFHPPCEVDFSQYDADNWQRCWLASLPDFNQSNPTVAAALVRSTAYLVHTFSFDAIRVDAAHHMPPEFVRSLASHLGVPAFAELSIPLLPLPHRLLAGRAYTNHATAELQQALQLTMVRAFTGGNTGSDGFTHSPAAGYTLARAMAAVFEGAGNADFQGSFLDNHDSPRLLGLLHGDQLLLRNALVLLLTSRGIPLVYSGTEQVGVGGWVGLHGRARPAEPRVPLALPQHLHPSIPLPTHCNFLVLFVSIPSFPPPQAFMGGPDPQNRESLWPFLNTHHRLYGFLAAVIRFRHKVT